MSTGEPDAAKTDRADEAPGRDPRVASDANTNPRLSLSDKRKLERLLDMDGGYVLDLSNQHFADLIRESTGLDIYSNEYSEHGNSKAKRLRAFWSRESPRVVGAVLRELLDYYADTQETNADAQLLAKCDNIVARLLGNPTTAEENGWDAPRPQSDAKTVNAHSPDAAPPAVSISNSAEVGRAVAEAIMAVTSSTPTDNSGQVAEGADWRDVQRRLLEIRDRGEPYTSIAKLATELGCANATVKKAIDDSRELKGWQARHLESKRSPRATSMNDVVADNAEQSREADPTTNPELDDVDTVFARLIEEAKPEERAQLNSLDADKRRELVALLQNDPDKYGRILDRNP